MINITLGQKYARLKQAYVTLRRTIYWAKRLARDEWNNDNRHYPLRNYYKHGTLEDIKASWYLRNLIRLAGNISC